MDETLVKLTNTESGSVIKPQIFYTYISNIPVFYSCCTLRYCTHILLSPGISAVYD